MHPSHEEFEMFSLMDRVALVSGSARGIGRETACTLARLGATVFAADILQDDLLPQRLRHAVLDDAADRVGGAARCERHDHGDGFVRIALR